MKLPYSTPFWLIWILKPGFSSTDSAVQVAHNAINNIRSIIVKIQNKSQMCKNEIWYSIHDEYS